MFFILPFVLTRVCANTYGEVSAGLGTFFRNLPTANTD